MLRALEYLGIEPQAAGLIFMFTTVLVLIVRDVRKQLALLEKHVNEGLVMHAKKHEEETDKIIKRIDCIDKSNRQVRERLAGVEKVQELKLE